MLMTAITARRCKDSFADFVSHAWHLIEPARPFTGNWCVSAIAEHLQAVSMGEIKKLIINIPPGMAKSSLVSVLWPCWDWTNNPALRWMFASHRMQLAFRDANRRRLVMMSIWYKELFGGGFEFTSEQLKYVVNTSQGSMFSSSVDSQDVLGFRADRLILDDPHDPQGAISEIQRATTTEWLNLTWPTRKNDTPNSAEVLVMQRLHENDATGLYLRQGDWVHLKIPMEYKGKTFSTSRYADPRTTQGELIDERIQSRAYVEDKKKRLGPWGEAAQYDQEPYPIGGGIFKRAWFKPWTDSDRNAGHIMLMDGMYHIDVMRHYRFCTVDPATTEKEIGDKKVSDPDYTCIAAWMAFFTPSGPLLVLLDLIRDRMEGPDILPKIHALHRHWRFSIIGIETAGFQLSLFQTARRAPYNLPVREISTKNDDTVIYRIDKDKVARAMAATPLMSSGRFFIPEYKPWVSEYLAEMCAFPNAAHDDTVDVTAAAVAIAEKWTGHSIVDANRDPSTPRMDTEARLMRDRRMQDIPSDPMDRFYGTRPPGL